MEALKQILRLPVSLSSLVILLSATVPLAAAEPSLTEDSQCGCYLTNGNRSSYFAGHKFFDFRSLSEYAGVPTAIRDANASAGADETSAFFTTPAWTDFWMLGTWNNSNGARADATVLMVNSPNNIYVEANNEPDPSSQTWLTLRTQRLSDDFQTAAEIESASAKYKYLSIRMRARTIGAPGAITAMFTYRGSDTLAKVQESDLEIRTSDPRNTIQYTNQPSYTDAGDEVEQATVNVTMPGGLDWTDWADHRMDWTPGMTTWYVNDAQVAQIAFQAPRDECTIILNAWSDGGKWAGNMSTNDAAYLQVQWLEVVYNSTDAGAKVKRAGEASCNRVCSVDQTPQLGKPVMLWNNVAGRASTGGVVAWLPAGVAMLMVLFSTGL
jgi:hypothetical protein